MKFVSLLLLYVCFAAPSFAADLLDDKPRVAVMSAFEPEWQALLSDISDAEDHVLNGRRYVTGQLAGKDVVVFLSGVSMVNAAMTTQQAIDHFAITSIVFSGIAGGVDPALSIGDVVISDQWGQYLEAIFARETNGNFAIPPFLDTQFPNFGMIFPNESEVLRDGLKEPEDRFWFPVDAKLLETARSAATQVELSKCAGEGRCLSHQPKVVVGGNGVSGPAFVDNAAFREFTFKTFSAKVLDMESAATAHVAYSNGIPFIAFRSLSDLAGGGEGANEMGVFFALASENSARFVKAFLAELP